MFRLNSSKVIMSILAVATLGAVVWISSFTFNQVLQNHDYTTDIVQLRSNANTKNEHDPPAQIHLALYDDTQTSSSLAGNGMTVSWATKRRNLIPSVVQFGLKPSQLSEKVVSSQQCEQYSFCDYHSACFHHVNIPAKRLLPETLYYYRCGNEASGWSEIKNFTTPMAIGNTKSALFALIGDLGQTEFSKRTLEYISSRKKDLRAIFHAGDLSYADSDQPRWDSWAKMVEPIASQIPWMVASGNHEEEEPCKAKTDPFISYQKRFCMPYVSEPDSLQQGNLYYGIRVGMTHFIILSPYIDTTRNSSQYRWLEEELGRVNRALTPWLCVLMHGPWYNSNTAHQNRREPHFEMKKNMESLLYDNKVDVVISGHVHAYERSLPVWKEQVRLDGIVYVVVGDGGNREGLASSFLQPAPQWSAFRKALYGYILWNVTNQTHAALEWYAHNEKGAQIEDVFWIQSTKFRVAQNFKH
uniref:Purple acid phosphatase n=1 Tax=Albugo laibachii Nc14 TaxID=890382 RepID=F0WT66_9STRA|nr:Iron(III)zinc(II) purple acid phosphatase putative [Albugo laibachii Nc14]|eukprot:CCA24554.1 Iron(III)zinc(II) purple acid phosphatase putative [Albugo laibachii Nc14]